MYKNGTFIMWFATRLFYITQEPTNNVQGFSLLVMIALVIAICLTSSVIQSYLRSSLCFTIISIELAAKTNSMAKPLWLYFYESIVCFKLTIQQACSHYRESRVRKTYGSITVVIIFHWIENFPIKKWMTSLNTCILFVLFMVFL